jgi:hypothetical protein
MEMTRSSHNAHELSGRIPEVLGIEGPDRLDSKSRPAIKAKFQAEDAAL